MKQFKKMFLVLISGFIILYACFGETTFLQKGFAAEQTYATTDNLNVRTGPSTKYTILGVIPKGERIDVKSATGTGWYQILYKEKKGYVSSQYIKITKKVQGEEVLTAKNYATTANLNVRTGPSTKYAILGVIQKSERIDVKSATGTGWYQILYKGKKGYVFSQYVKIIKNERWEEEVIPVVAKPNDMAVLINKQNKLPANFVPNNLVDSGISFPFTNNSEKKKLRKEAAVAIQTLVRDAKKAGITIVGVSGYRSYTTQVSLFESYVKQDGYEKARMYSAIPGTSEHQTGLAIDVGNNSATCAATSCFQDTNEAKWLHLHVAEYGFIIRYPKGKEAITGYVYEPWHLRYVGKVVATDIMKRGITLEEYNKGLLVKR
jgi:zinc D-Ala-D-Ala carboxypeptidase